MRGWNERFLKEVDVSRRGAVIECTEVFWVYNKLLNRFPDAQVSDTTKDDSSNIDG